MSLILLFRFLIIFYHGAPFQKTHFDGKKHQSFFLFFLSLDSIDSIDENGDGKVSIFSVAMSLRRKEKSGKPMPLQLRPQTKATKNWLKALHLTREREDPWEKFHLDELPVEKAIRHKYNALTQTWSTEEVVVKMDPESFAQGAMRECYRMKKLSNFSCNLDWGKDSNNYVAKSYMETVDRNIYFEDVKLQCDAKLWGEECKHQLLLYFFFFMKNWSTIECECAHKSTYYGFQILKCVEFLCR